MQRLSETLAPLAVLCALLWAPIASANDGSAARQLVAANDTHAGHEGHAGHADHAGNDDHAGHDPHAAHRAAAGKSKTSGTITLDLDDTILKDQDGRDVRLMSGLLGQRVTVVDFVYTTCTTVCPVLSATFAELQRKLGERVGTDVQLVSITVDPLRDTPARLKAYSAKHDAGSGWRWLTGSKGSVDSVLKAFGAYTPDPESHPAMVMIGDAEGRTWTRLYGFPSVADIQAQVEQALSRQTARKN